MRVKGLLALCASAALCGCQTNNQADYVQIGFGPSFDVAHAQCELQKRSADQGYIAIGSPAFVAGAGLGNAIDNAIAEDLASSSTVGSVRHMDRDLLRPRRLLLAVRRLPTG